MSKIKALLKLADTVIKTAETLKDKFQGKSPREALDHLKKNIESLNSPTTLINIQRALKGENPKDVFNIVRNARQDLSIEDALKIAQILTDDSIEESLPEYLKDKLESGKKTKPSKPTPKKPRGK